MEASFILLIIDTSFKFRLEIKENYIIFKNTIKRDRDICLDIKTTDDD